MQVIVDPVLDTPHRSQSLDILRQFLLSSPWFSVLDSLTTSSPSWLSAKLVERQGTIFGELERRKWTRQLAWRNQECPQFVLLSHRVAPWFRLTFSACFPFFSNSQNARATAPNLLLVNYITTVMNGLLLFESGIQREEWSCDLWRRMNMYRVRSCVKYLLSLDWIFWANTCLFVGVPQVRPKFGQSQQFNSACAIQCLEQALQYVVVVGWFWYLTRERGQYNLFHSRYM